MSEQPEQDRQQVRDAAAAAMADALVREAVGLMVLAVVVLALDQRVRIWAAGLARQVRWNLRDRRKAHIDQQVAQFSRVISDFEHARRRDGGCGCGEQA